MKGNYRRAAAQNIGKFNEAPILIRQDEIGHRLARLRGHFAGA